ncbi:MAG: ABC transporter permease subunit [Gammaproteobacteria bacterium]|nr:ABC transporter permease subunit [Gammaproteobacteria bacterium]MCI0591449.1 ABC transporter permease subunit [Gammaproteobacteria bacterium]
MARAITPRETVLPRYHDPAAVRHRQWRRLKDLVTEKCVALGGISVIIAIVLIFFYLIYVVVPLFKPATMERVADYPAPGNAASDTLHIAIEEQNEIGLSITSDARAVFFRTKDGSVIQEVPLSIARDAFISAISAGDLAHAAIALGLSNGRLILLRHVYDISHPNDIRVITPRLEYPLGDKPIPIDATGRSLMTLAAQSNDEETTVVALTGDRRLVIVNFALEGSLLEDKVSVERGISELPVPATAVTRIALNMDQRELYLASGDGFISYYDITNKSAPRLIQRIKAVPDGTDITVLRFLSGGISLLVGDSRGTVTQWFPVRDENNNYTLQRIRTFTALEAPITGITPEYYRKGFAAIDQKGRVAIYHTTAERTLRVEQAAADPLIRVALSPRANGMLLVDAEDKYQFWHIRNPHPEVSWNALWGKVWYESRTEPEYIWQSSSASNTFEPKFSLTPLTFGTVKAAFYAMLFAIPLAILGAIYTAYFMAPRMRAAVKPTIEIMEALPTVILGFLAGLWLAPIVESHLPGIFCLLLLLPVSIVTAAFLWSRLPADIRHGVPDGWEAALLIPVVCLTGVVAIAISQPIESLFFNGNMPQWLNDRLGISYDQRNSLVVGFAMGFAVIPNIFSISEDAIFGVPKHLTIGSLALGATPWQTVVGVVLLTASPGIFSAVMIGLGRAVGETMIVLMATGNTPVIDFNIFAGFRALSANIAVEMPETEVNSTHYRILFLAALVLFIVTFMFNTIAEIVRQRLRAKYSSL